MDSDLNKEDRVAAFQNVKTAVKTFDHCCGRKKNTYIRFMLRHIGCSVSNCHMCRPGLKSKNKIKGTHKQKSFEKREMMDSASDDIC